MSQNKTKKNSRKRQRQKPKWLPILIILGGLLVVGLAFLALRDKPNPAAAVEVSGAPSLKADKEKIDLGDMKFNQPAEVSFQIANVGDQTLRLTKDPYIEVVEGC
jgi:cell division septal protein FtsQ